MICRSGPWKHWPHVTWTSPQSLANLDGMLPAVSVIRQREVEKHEQQWTSAKPAPGKKIFAGGSHEVEKSDVVCILRPVLFLTNCPPKLSSQASFASDGPTGIWTTISKLHWAPPQIRPQLSWLQTSFGHCFCDSCYRTVQHDVAFCFVGLVKCGFRWR